MHGLARFSTFLLVILMIAAPGVGTAQTRLDADTAGRFAGLALACVDQEYPNLIHHTMAGGDEVGQPHQLTPAFYGCFDWHSSVHGHWLLVRLSRLFPDSTFADQARDKLAANLTEGHLLAEAAYMAHPERTGFERPYGLAWLLQLVAELDQWGDDGGDNSDDKQVGQWREWLRPLETIAVRHLSDWIPKLHYPIRIGEHDQTAFSFGLALDYARQVGNDELAGIIEQAAMDFYADDRNCPLNYEPSGHDFLSPCLAEADLMRRVMTTDKFADWLDGFLPEIGEENWLPVAVVTDRADGKLAHIDGLNLSRAWMLQGIAANLPADDDRHKALQASAAQHAEAGLAGVGDEHYAGGHWLASFAVYLLSERGFDS